MNRNRHMQYRRSVYRRRHIRTVIITVIVAVAVLIALFLIIGNVLFDKTAEESEAPPANNEETKDFAIPADSVRQINGCAVSLAGGASELRSSLDAAVENGFSEISVLMNDENGALYHYSEIADSLGLTVALSDTVSVAELTGAADERSLYVSGVYYIDAFSVEDDLLRSVEMSKTAALIAESLRAGLDEVILFAPDISNEQIAEVTHLINEIRTFVSEAVVGFALPEALVTSQDAELIDSLASSVSFLALELSRYGENESVDFAKNGMQFYLLRYKMRVIIPVLEDKEKQSEMVSSVESAGVTNKQMLNY